MTALAQALSAPPKAEAPPEALGLPRDAVRLLGVSIPDGRMRHLRFAELPDLLEPGDLLAINRSATLAAALPVRRRGAPLTLHLSTPLPGASEDVWVVELRRGGSRARDGREQEMLELPGGASARLLAPYLGTRLWVAALALPEPLGDYLGHHGGPIRYGRPDRRRRIADYQTAYATEPGSAEMPSAGRPLTAALLTRLVARGIDVAPLVLHTGVSSLEQGERPYPERFEVPAATAERIAAARRVGGRVVAVGTTVVRALESASDEGGQVRAARGWTNLVIEPDSDVRAVDGVLTGFHDADSSHLWMLEAIAGREVLEHSYRVAVEAGYRGHEFGDAQLLLPATASLRGASRGPRSG